jgi:hypothetical protein
VKRLGTSLSWSKFNRAMVCVGSMVLPQAREASRYGADGTGRHERFRATIREAIKTEDWTKVPDEIHALIPRGSVIFTEYGVAYNFDKHSARPLEEGEADPQHEIPGHLDLMIRTPSGAITVLDLKGYDEVPAPKRNGQLLGYALCASLIAGVHEVTVVIVHADVLEDGTIVIWHDSFGPRVHYAKLYDDDLYAFSAVVRRVLAKEQSAATRWQLGEMPATEESDECRWCSSWLNCPVQTGHVRMWSAGKYPEAMDYATPIDDAKYEEMLRSADAGATPMRKYIEKLAAAKKAFGERVGKKIGRGGGKRSTTPKNDEAPIEQSRAANE